MKKFLSKALLFFILLLIIILIISPFDNLDKSITDNSNVVSLQQKSRFDALDILFVGNSYCYSGIMPIKFDKKNIKTYNLGIATAGPYFYELITNDYLIHTKTKPKFIFVLVSPMTFSNYADNFMIYPVHRYLEKQISNEGIVVDYNLEAKYLDFLTKSVKKGLSNLFLNKQKNFDKELIESKGFIGSIVINNKKSLNNSEHLYLPLLSEEFDTKKFEYMIDYFIKIKEKGIEIVYFELPTNLSNNYFNKTYLKEYNEALKILESKSLLIPNNLKLENHFFRNIDHLNTEGAKLVTQNLINNISKDTLFSPILKGE